MSQQLPCNLLLGIQTVSLRVNKEEEFCVRNAALLVNRLVKFYEKKANSSDPNAVMALVALDLAMCGLKFETETRSLNSNVQSENEQILALVDEFQL
jgi:cell division protein ZapA (FtsZ GTPase activity inhibitor)